MAGFTLIINVWSTYTLKEDVHCGTVTMVMDLLAVGYHAGQPVQGAMANSDSSVSGLRPLRVPMTQGIHHSPGPFNTITLYVWPT